MVSLVSKDGLLNRCRRVRIRQLANQNRPAFCLAKPSEYQSSLAIVPVLILKQQTSKSLPAGGAERALAGWGGLRGISSHQSWSHQSWRVSKDQRRMGESI